MKRIFIFLSNKQKGFTLIELALSVGLSGILGLGISTFAVQTFTESVKSQNRTQAVVQVENAGYWLGRDVQMAENVTLGENAGFPLQLERKDIDQNEYEISYVINEGEMKRIMVVNDQEPDETFISQSISSDPELTNCSYADGLLTLNITAEAGTIDMSRTYQIKRRLDIE